MAFRRFNFNDGFFDKFLANLSKLWNTLRGNTVVIISCCSAIFSYLISENCLSKQRVSRINNIAMKYRVMLDVQRELSQFDDIWVQLLKQSYAMPNSSVAKTLSSLFRDRSSRCAQFSSFHADVIVELVYFDKYKVTSKIFLSQWKNVKHELLMYKCNKARVVRCKKIRHALYSNNIYTR